MKGVGNFSWMAKGSKTAPEVPEAPARMLQEPFDEHLARITQADAVRRLVQRAHQDQTPEAIDDALRLTVPGEPIGEGRIIVGRRALQRLKAPGMAVDSAVDELTNGVATYGGGLVIVIDDLHVISEAQCLASIEQFAGFVLVEGADGPIMNLEGQHSPGFQA